MLPTAARTPLKTQDSPKFWRMNLRFYSVFLANAELLHGRAASSQTSAREGRSPMHLALAPPLAFLRRRPASALVARQCSGESLLRVEAPNRVHTIVTQLLGPCRHDAVVHGGVVVHDAHEHQPHAQVVEIAGRQQPTLSPAVTLEERPFQLF